MHKTVVPTPYPYFQANDHCLLYICFLKQKSSTLAILFNHLHSLVFSKDFIVSTSLVWPSDPRSAACAGNSACHAHKLPRHEAWEDQNNSLEEIPPLYIAFPIWS